MFASGPMGHPVRRDEMFAPEGRAAYPAILGLNIRLFV
jgi:hypothetical protein